jgi:hypothetical protein
MAHFALLLTFMLLLATRAQRRPWVLGASLILLGLNVWLQSNTLECWELLLPLLGGDPASAVVDAGARVVEWISGVPLALWLVLGFRDWRRQLTQRPARGTQVPRHL